ncbi:MAG: hypothetical protein WAS21_25495 [Geminicoccaceae bacterium]
MALFDLDGIIKGIIFPLFVVAIPVIFPKIREWLRGHPAAAGSVGGAAAALVAILIWSILTPPPTIPQGVVVAATVECSSLGAGWAPYPGAKGRFLIGEGTGTDDAGNEQNFEAGKSHGEYKHKLEPDEMPSHNHSFTGTPTVRGENAGSGLTLAGGRSPQLGMQYEPLGDWSPNGTIGMSGGDKAHNNLPPYLVVWYCQHRDL